MTGNKLPENLCMAPFSYITFDSAMNVSPCPALGGGVWNFKGQTILEVWNNVTLTEFRQHMLDNKRHETICQRCWSEEADGMKSERLMLWDINNDPTGTSTNLVGSGQTPVSQLQNDRYKDGPLQVIIKISNVCNLRCRSCNSADSYTLSIEGKYYSENYDILPKNNFYLKSTERHRFTDDQIDEIADVCSRATRIEFYGGEPLYDHQCEHLLTRIANNGVAENITINISTNITKQLNDEFVRVLAKFKHVNINLSIDGWGNHFTYLRHPGNWDDVYNNIKYFVNLLETSDINLSLLPVCTVTSMNVYYLPELITNLREHFDLPVFLILSYYPIYFSIKHIPDPIANQIIEKLTGFELHDLTPVINRLANKGNKDQWQLFQKWTAMIDQYRGESFADTFPEYYKLIVSNDSTFDLDSRK